MLLLQHMWLNWRRCFYKKRHRCMQLGGKPGKGRETDLAKREAELNAREAELKRWEADLRSSGRLRPKKNWPKCCPITVMDIKGAPATWSWCLTLSAWQACRLPRIL